MPTGPRTAPQGGPRYSAGPVFFFSSRRPHTIFDCDWSSDVCSSDLLLQSPDHSQFQMAFRLFDRDKNGFISRSEFLDVIKALSSDTRAKMDLTNEPLVVELFEIGRASCRERA